MTEPAVPDRDLTPVAALIGDPTPAGRSLLTELGIDPERLARSRRMFARGCVDWTQRHPHLAGALPAALTARLLELGWLSRATGRALRAAPDYDQRLDAWLAGQR